MRLLPPRPWMRTKWNRDECLIERKATWPGVRWIETRPRSAVAKLVRIGPCEFLRSLFYGFPRARSIGRFYIARRASYHRPRMKPPDVRRIAAVILAIATGVQAATDSPTAKIDPAQIPKWSAEDLDFFLHGSILKGCERYDGH